MSVRSPLSSAPWSVFSWPFKTQPAEPRTSELYSTAISAFDGGRRGDTRACGVDSSLTTSQCSNTTPYIIVSTTFPLTVLAPELEPNAERLTQLLFTGPRLKRGRSHHRNLNTCPISEIDLTSPRYCHECVYFRLKITSNVRDVLIKGRFVLIFHNVISRLFIYLFVFFFIPFNCLRPSFSLSFLLIVVTQIRGTPKKSK